MVMMVVVRPWVYDGGVVMMVVVGACLPAG